MRRRRVALASLAMLASLGAWVAWHLPRAEVVTVAPREVVRAPLRPGTASLLFLGDTGLGDAAEATLAREGFTHALAPTIDLVQGVDLAVANEEMPITDADTRFPLYKEYVYRARPGAALALARAGVDVLALANNHVIDYGARGTADTIALSRAAGMETLGAGPDEASARQGVVARIGDVRVGLLAYCERQLLWAVYVDNFAREGHGGAAALTEEALRADVARLRPLVDVLVVSLHIGYNYEAPTARSLAWSRLAIDVGADLVVNHHPHIAHPLVEHRGRLIALSLGNWAFGTPGHADLDLGEMLFVHLAGKRVARAEVLPLDVQNRRVRFAPRPLTGSALDDGLARLQRESAAFGTKLERVDDRLVWRAP